METSESVPQMLVPEGGVSASFFIKLQGLQSDLLSSDAPPSCNQKLSS